MKQHHFFSQTVFVLAILFIPFGTSCQNWNSKDAIKGNGEVSTQSRTVDNFHSIEVGSGLDLHINQGNTQEVKVKADENLQSAIIVKVKDSVLEIYTDKYIKKASASDIYVTVTELKLLDVSGGSDVESKGNIKCNDFNASISGGSDVDLELTAINTNWEISGASDVNLKGSAETANLKVSGASDFEGDEFKVVNCDANVSGASDLDIFVSGELNAIASGASDVTYSGDPKKIIQKLSGASDINRRD